MSSFCNSPQFEADRRAFIITINSFGTALNRDDRVKLYPTIGKLHPDGLIMLSKASDYDEVRQVADNYKVQYTLYGRKYADTLACTIQYIVSMYTYFVLNVYCMYVVRGHTGLYTLHHGEILIHFTCTQGPA